MASIATLPHVLVTGGAGYIGSHTCVELLNAGFRITILDNLDNSSQEAIRRVLEISGTAPETLVLREADLVDYAATAAVFDECGPFDACIHFAGLKAVGESCKLPLHYYANNIGGTVNLLRLLQRSSCRRVVFSSSATVYGDPEVVPIPEEHPLRCTNAYGRTKLFIEDIMRDVSASEPEMWSIALLRYFNPIGAHVSGRIGEDPKGIPNNLVPYISQVAVGRRPKLGVFGADYDTVDGTGVRDYIHVVDLALGHVAAIQKVTQCAKPLGVEPYNLGTGNGTSVLQMVQAFEVASGRKVPYEIQARRPGDIATCFADASKAKSDLGWSAKLSLERMCVDTWRWQSNNPNGYRKDSDATSPTAETRKCQVFETFA